LNHRLLGLAAIVATAVISCPAAAETPRALLITAAFHTPDKQTALSRISTALKGAEAAVARNPKDMDARLQCALAISYRGKLTRNRGDLVTARKAFEAVVAADPTNAEAQMALAGWHLGAVIELGPMLARTALGARKATGIEALNQAIRLGGDRPIFPAFASLTHIQLNPGDIPGTRRLAEAAVKRRAATPIDQIMQKQAAALLQALRGGDGKAAAKTAKMLLPFGRIH
jgi:hypothetical protein